MIAFLDLTQIVEEAFEIGLAGLGVGALAAHHREQRLELSGVVGDVVQLDDRLRLGDRQSDPPAPQRQRQAGAVALVEHAPLAVARGLDDAVLLVEADGAQADAELVGELADRPRPHAVRVPAASWRSSRSIACSRNLNFWILPVTVIGNSAVVCT